MAGLPGPTILIIEDNPITRHLVSHALMQHGYQVLEARDGATALQLAGRPWPIPGLILQDLALPDMSGFDLVRRIRALPSVAETPILAFTGFLTRADEAHMLASGFNGVLIKPIEPSRLVREIEPYLPPEAEPATPTGPRVLVVDDDPVQLRTTKRALARQGFDVATASGGAAALAEIERARPALVVSDVLMPDMDGFELAARIRTQAATSRLPVLLITNHFVAAEDRQLALQLGAQDMIVRSDTLDEAAARIRALVGVEPAEVPELGSFSEVQRRYLKRINAQLLRQVETNTGLSQRVSLLATSMSVLGTVARMLGSAAEADQAVAEVLAQCVDAAGLSRGALFLRRQDTASWRCAAQTGFGGVPDTRLDALFGYTTLLDEVVAAGFGRALSSADPDPAVQTLLALCAATSAVVAPVEGGAGDRGTLVLAAATMDLKGVEWSGFAHAIAGQLGQALALGTAFRTLATSEQQHRLLVDSVREYSLILLDTDGRIATWNAGSERIHGYAASQVVGRSFAVFHTAEDVERGWPEELVRVALERGTARDEGWRRRADGSLFWAETVLSRVLGPDGRPTGIAKITRDTTDQRRAEALFRNAVDAAPNGMIVVDDSGAIMLVNKQITEMFGYPADELLGRSVARLLPARYRSQLERLRDTLGQGQTALPMGAERNLHGLRVDGTEFPIEIGLNPVITDDASFVIASVIDITERRAYERALAIREARVRALMENANDGIAVLSTTGIVLESNQRWPEILGRPMGDIVGTHIATFADAPADAQRLREAAATGSARVNGVRFRRPDGMVCVLDISQSEVRLGDETVLFTIARDVTRQEMLERQLRQSQKMDAIGRLAGGVAHDFNNLLTAVQGNATFVLEALPPDSELREDIEEIVRATERAAALTGQLLAFSRKQVRSPRVLDLAALVSDAERLLGRLIGEDIRLATVLDPETGNVRADPGQLEQVVLNLVVNARDAMPQGGTATIETRNVDLGDEYIQSHIDVEPGAYVMLAVSDTGVGMSDEVQARIFEPFFTTKEAGKGTGLGLATVYGIVEQSGGFIGVYSEAGVGTTFKVYLPRHFGDAEMAAAPMRKHPTRGDETVLVAEDDALVRRLLVRSLERFGYTVHAAADPEAALRIADGLVRPADLLVTDVVMPGMSGRILAERLIERWPGLRVLYTSGYTDDAIVHHGVLEEGMAFLPKPYTPSGVAVKVRQVLDR